MVPAGREEEEEAFSLADLGPSTRYPPGMVTMWQEAPRPGPRASEAVCPNLAWGAGLSYLSLPLLAQSCHPLCFQGLRECQRGLGVGSRRHEQN